MNNLPKLPPKYRSWTDLYLAVESELKTQGATYAPRGMDGAELLEWLEDPNRTCRVDDDFEVKIQWREDLFVDTGEPDTSALERFWVVDEKVVRIRMGDVKLQIFEEAMQVLREREVLIQLRHIVHTHIPPMHPMYNDFEKLIARILEIT